MARYKDAIRWIIDNDDTEFLDGEMGTGEGQLSVTASLVADLFGKTDDIVRLDLLDERRRYHRKTTASVARGLTHNA